MNRVGSHWFTLCSVLGLRDQTKMKLLRLMVHGTKSTVPHTRKYTHARLHAHTYTYACTQTRRFHEQTLVNVCRTALPRPQVSGRLPCPAHTVSGAVLSWSLLETRVIEAPKPHPPNISYRRVEPQSEVFSHVFPPSEPCPNMQG